MVYFTEDSQILHIPADDVITKISLEALPSTVEVFYDDVKCSGTLLQVIPVGGHDPTPMIDLLRRKRWEKSLKKETLLRMVARIQTKRRAKFPSVRFQIKCILLWCFCLENYHGFRY